VIEDAAGNHRNFSVWEIIGIACIVTAALALVAVSMWISVQIGEGQ
jgi:hypothetical protein